MVDVKKLIAGFLILAAGTSSSVLIFSYFTPHTNSGAASVLSANSNLSPLGNNAFVSQPSSDDAGNALTPDVLNNPNNLTGNLTDTLLNGIITANPQGPMTDADGNPTMTPPDQAKMIAELSQSAAFKNLKIPDWDADAAAQKLNIITDNSTSSMLTYLGTFNNIFKKDISQTGIQSLINQNTDADPDALAVTASAVTDAFQEAVQIPTPSNLLSFQKSFVKFLTYEKNALQVAEGATDPLKSSFILQGESKKYQMALDQFKDEIQKNPFNGLLSLGKNPDKEFSLKNIPDTGKQNGFPTFFDATFGIPTAYAQVDVWDAVTEVETLLTSIGTWQQLGQWVLQEAESVALQAMKNFLIAEIQNQTLKWVRGNNNVPRFITSWATTLINVYTAKAASMLDSITPYLCPSFGPLIKIALSPRSSGGGAGGAGIGSGFQTCSQTMMNAANMRNFYNNFGSGGWNSYFTMLQPNNNFYSQLMSTQDAMAVAASNQQAATKAQSVAAQGFTGDQVCADGSNPNGTTSWCLDNNGDNDYISSDGTCPSGYTLDNEPNNGLCADGSEPITTTPGQTTNQVFSKALGSNVDLIVNANNIEGILATYASSLMTKLINNAVGNGGSSNGVAVVAPSNLPAQNASSTALSCTPISLSTGPQAQVTFTARGGSFAPDGSSPTYTWNAPGSTPATATGQIFSTVYHSVGNHTVTVTASTDGTTATCYAIVKSLNPVSCSPASQLLRFPMSGPFNVSAHGGTIDISGNPPTYTWSTPGAAGVSFGGTNNSLVSGMYNATGTYYVTVTASTDETTSTCSITL